MAYWLFGLIPFVSIIAITALLATKPGRPRGHERLGAVRSHATEAEIEDEDIAQMLEARNAIRRRQGKPLLGDELVEELRRGWSDGPPPTRAERDRDL